MPYYMEENLDMPLREVLQVMQNRIMKESTYWGIKTLKSPIDFWIYMEIIFESKPDVILEIGSYNGGSTLALAHICDCLGKGKVIALDISHAAAPEQVRNHPKITLLEGDACALFDRVAGLINQEDKVLINEDSSHTYENTLNVLRRYSTYLRPGDYFIVEDGICHHGLVVGPNPGPYEAIEDFVKENKDFVIDRNREPFIITWNPKGYLKRIDFQNQTSPPFWWKNAETR